MTSGAHHLGNAVIQVLACRQIDIVANSQGAGISAYMYKQRYLHSATVHTQSIAAPNLNPLNY